MDDMLPWTSEAALLMYVLKCHHKATCHFLQCHYCAARPCHDVCTIWEALTEPLGTVLYVPHSATSHSLHLVRQEELACGQCRALQKSESSRVNIKKGRSNKNSSRMRNQLQTLC